MTPRREGEPSEAQAVVERLRAEAQLAAETGKDFMVIGTLDLIHALRLLAAHRREFLKDAQLHSHAASNDEEANEWLADFEANALRKGV